ncbi:hypothetical protein ACWDYH_01335 [Nocardia goodfellowii]
MTEPRSVDVQVVSTSNASDLGFLALADLAHAAAGIAIDEDGGYRVIGGHMVQLLIHAYPTPSLQIRGTADADAGVSRPVAAGQRLHERLQELGYEAEKGNRYGKTSTEGRMAVDLLVPFGDTGKASVIEGRGFDTAPGLSMAIQSPPLSVTAEVRLRNGDRIRFTVLIPDVEAAVILKALAWKSRCAGKDVADLCSLFEIAHHHGASITAWRLREAALTGTRRDAAAALAQLVSRVERGTVDRQLFVSSPARFGALVRNLVTLD